jgi:hypothetical protein
MRRISLKNNVCMCCNTNRSPNQKQLLCKECYTFIHKKLGITPSFISNKLSMHYNNKVIKHDCSFCDNTSMVSYKDYENSKKYYICKKHLDRWLKIGCQLGEFSNYLTKE